jgi:hypothetical protein
MIVCPKCNRQNPDAAVLCEACYTPLPALMSCPSCGTSVQADASFCGQCGFNLQAASQATPPPIAMPASALSEQPSKQFYQPELMSEPNLPDPNLPEANLPDSNLPESNSQSSNLPVETATNPQLPNQAFSAQPPTSTGDPVASPTLGVPEWDVPEFNVAEAESSSGVAPVEIPALTPPEPLVEPLAEPPAALSAELPVESSAPEPSPNPWGVIPESSFISESEALPISSIPASPDPSSSPPSPVMVSAGSQTQLQTQSAQLLHVQTNTMVELPGNLAVIHLGKPNDRIPPDVDVSGFPHSEIVSRIHADIRVEGDIYYIEDVGSSNGTYINNAPLPSGNRHRLRPGDRIALGKGDKVTFLFQIA